MKANLTIAGACIAAIFSTRAAAQTDLAIGNIDAGWDTYNSSTGVITGVYFDVLNNENGNPGAFGIEVYLVDPNDFNNNYVVWSYTDNDGQNGNTVVTYDNIDIDFNTTPGIPGGQYRLAVCVDPAEDVSETDENNNCLYISTQGNNLTYNPNTAGVEDATSTGGVLAYPNPATDQLSFIRQNTAEMTTVSILDLSGKTVKTASLNTQSTQVNIGDLTAGIYIYRIMNSAGVPVAAGKFVKK